MIDLKIDNAALIATLLLAPIISSLPVAFAWLLEPKREWARKLPIFSVLGLFVSLICSLYILLNFGRLDEAVKVSFDWFPGYNISFTFIFDYLSKIMGVLTALIAFLIGVYGLEYMKHDYRLGWYWFFFNLFTASMLLVVYSDNLLMLLIGWEGLGLASWGLIGHWFRDDDDMSFVGNVGRKIAGINYFWSPSLGAWRAISTIRLGDMPMFFAIAAIFLFAGTLNISEIHWHELAEKVGALGVFLILFAFLLGPFTKSAQLPFSEWLMTAMTGPTTVSALLHSATMVAAGTYVFMRLSWYMEPWNIHNAGIELIYVLVLFLGLISALYGALVALGCLERKVLLAASTMSSLGLMFATASASFWIGKFAILVAFWYLVTHAFAKATLFLVAGHLIHETHDRFCVGGKDVAKNLKFAFIATIVATLGLSGIPPLTAYWVKSAMDGIMHHLEHEFGTIPLILLVLTSAVYSAFLAKFLSLNFIKGEFRIKAHGGGGLMSSAYILMCSMLILLLVIYLKVAEFQKFVKEGFLESSLTVGLIVLVTYLITLIKPRLESPLSKALGDRLYLAILNDLIISKIGWALAKVVDYGNRAIDFFCHRAIPDTFDLSSRGIRRVQSGSIELYLKISVATILILLVLAVALGVIV
ncbi:MAG: NADH-quinone oxidoreductase subunit L [Archaeoglobaceae archaeon]|nr:NADH-quinone oxidoreductase subunit L [Archaeoglobaceae archaeon]MDW8118556.1 NADH-quinone oxidoreductase subunit L [Archaeoglobaceae archaeon]